VHRFSTFTKLQEMAAVNISDLDSEFLTRALRVTSFNLSSADFQTLKYKAEIQHLFHLHFFKKFDLSKTISGDITVNKGNAIIKELKQMNSKAFNALHFYNLKGVGPGEATLFFICDKAKLGGGGSAGVDIMIGGKKYEVKAVTYSKATNSVAGFKLGGTVPLGDLVTKAVALKNSLGLTTAGKGQAEVNKTQIEEIKKKYPKEWNEIETKYGRVAQAYFGNTDVIFINNNNTSGRLSSNGGGEILAIKKVRFNDIKIEQITQGTIKPRVQL